MKKKIFSIILAAIMVLLMLPVSAFAEVDSLSDVTFTVGANVEAGLDGDVKVKFTMSNNNYIGTLYLPGGADTTKLTLSWDEDVSVLDCVSGETSIPANGESKTYSVTVGGSTANFIITTMQGSAEVDGMFLNIDEDLGTIAAMNGDSNHETECFGLVAFDGSAYDMSIKGRGNSTWSQKKKPYNITIYKDIETDGAKKQFDKKKSVELIDGVKAKKWSLLANYLDNTLIRNKIGYDLADSLGIGLKSRFVDIWMNGEYIGNYLITPKNDYLASDDGFILELDNKKEPENGDPQFTLDGLKEPSSAYFSRFTVKSIGEDSGLSVDDIKAWMNTAWKAIQNYDSDDYLNYIDIDSWAKMYLANEIYRNIDIISGSIYMHREGLEASDKLIAGPVWDLDLAIGRNMTSGFSGMSNSTQRAADNWYIDNINSSGTNYVCWFQELGKHASFMSRVYEIYNEYAAEFAAMNDNTATQAAINSASTAMDSKVWGNVITSAGDYVSYASTYGSGNYSVYYEKTTSRESAVKNLKTYVSARLAFLSDKLTVTAPTGSITGTTSYAVGDALSLTADCSANSYQWQSSADGTTWTNIEGATGNVYSAAALYTMDGLKIRCVAKNTGNIINTTRVAKVAAAAAMTTEPVTLTVSLEGHEHNHQMVVTSPTCTEQGYTTYTCACGDSYVKDYTDALKHDFVNGRCTLCQEKDPAYIPQCVVDKSVSLSEGSFTFTLGGQELGEYSFARSGSNWTIKNDDGYLGFANNNLSDNAFGWTYSNGRFQTSVTTTNSGWGGWGGWGNWGQNSTTTYYLVYTNGRIAVSTSTSGANTGFTQHIENLTHSFGAWTTKNSGHSRICSVCGVTESGKCSYGEWTTQNGIHSHTCSVCDNVDSSKCSYGAWITENGEHSHTCSVCGDTEQGSCTYGDWTPSDNNRHSHICSVCGDTEYGDCDYQYADHMCPACKRIDPSLTYVTATFITGEGASEAPKKQTVIQNEGFITEPENDPTRIGFIFDGWYIDNLVFTFNTVISEDITITAKWKECTEHEYDEETHICPKCGLKNPDAVVRCSGDKTVSLTSGNLLFTLGEKDLGEYTFTKVNNSTWTIRENEKDKYLGFENKVFAYADEPFNWTFSNNRFQTSVTTTSGGNSSWGGFNWNWGRGSSSRTTTTTYYLAYVNGNITVSTSTSGTNASFRIHVENDEHTGSWTTIGKTHTRVCEICGEEETENCTYGDDHRCIVCNGYNPDDVVVNVSVSKSQRSSGNSSRSWGWSFGWGSSSTTTYSATITATAIGTTVVKVEYSTNGGTKWTNSNTVTSNSQIGSFLIRVTDGNGTVHNFSYDGTNVTLL